jgi:hypothetical protein
MVTGPVEARVSDRWQPPGDEPDFGRVRVTTTLMLGPRAGVAPTPEPAAARVRTNLHALRQVLQRSHAGEIRSAEAVVDVTGSANVGDQRTR